jgi:ribonuclease VapC
VVVDTSALVAVLGEPDSAAYVKPLWAAPSVALSAVNAYECRLVLSAMRQGRPRFDPSLMAKLDELVAAVPIEVVPFDRQQALLAHEAYLHFGKGFHRAALNMADCAGSRCCSRATTSP